MPVFALTTNTDMCFIQHQILANSVAHHILT